MDDLDLELSWVCKLSAWEVEIWTEVAYRLIGRTLVHESSLNHEKQAIEFAIDIGVRLMDCHYHCSSSIVG